MNNTNDTNQNEGTDTRLLLLSPLDNVFVIAGAIEAGEEILVSGVRVSFEARLGLGTN